MLNTHVEMSHDPEAEAANSAPSNDAASARKRRKLIIQSQRSEAEHPASDGNAAGSSDDASDSSVKSESEGQPSSSKSRGHDKSSSESKQNRTQVKYNPDIPMSKEQLAAWRREARRVRNRESAAASRQRIRNRISELEDEVREPTLMFQLGSVCGTLLTDLLRALFSLTCTGWGVEAKVCFCNGATKSYGTKINVPIH